MAKRKHPGGRPPIITPPVLSKLEEVFALGGTDKEACLYADIGMATLYKYQNRFPEFVERKAMLKEKPVLRARRTLNSALENDATTARWYVERRDKDFNPKQEVDLTSKGEKLEGSSDIAAIAAKAAELLKQEKTTHEL